MYRDYRSIGNITEPIITNYLGIITKNILDIITNYLGLYYVQKLRSRLLPTPLQTTWYRILELKLNIPEFRIYFWLSGITCQVNSFQNTT